MFKMKQVALAVALGLASTSMAYADTTYVFRNFIPGANASVCTPVKLGGPIAFSYTGSVQEISVPAGAVYAKAMVLGAGGGGANGGPVSGSSTDSGGSGASLYGQVPVKPGSNLYVLVGGGGANEGDGSGGGGGLSGIFAGTPSQATALLVAGGGGGGANSKTPHAYDDGSNAGLQPGKAITGQPGGMGYGGAGIGLHAGEDGTPFGAGGASTAEYSGPGGFGGAASGGQAWGSGGGGGGMPGGSGGRYDGQTTYGLSYGGQGGTSFAASSIKDVHQGSLTAAGGYSSGSGQNGSAQITFYGCS